MTERRETRRALAAESERLAVTLGSIADGVISTDLLKAWSCRRTTPRSTLLGDAAATSLVGWPLDEHIAFLDETHPAGRRAAPWRAR